MISSFLLSVPVTTVHYQAEVPARKLETALFTSNAISFAVRDKLIEIELSFTDVWVTIKHERITSIIIVQVWGIIIGGKVYKFEARYAGDLRSLLDDLLNRAPLTLELEFRNMGELELDSLATLPDIVTIAFLGDGLKLMVIAVLARLADGWIKRLGFLIDLRIAVSAVVLLVFWSYIPKKFFN